jgi:hypothetical protein
LPSNCAGRSYPAFYRTTCQVGGDEPAVCGPSHSRDSPASGSKRRAQQVTLGRCRALAARHHAYPATERRNEDQGGGRRRHGLAAPRCRAGTVNVISSDDQRDRTANRARMTCSRSCASRPLSTRWTLQSPRSAATMLRYWRSARAPCRRRPAAITQRRRRRAAAITAARGPPNRPATASGAARRSSSTPGMAVHRHGTIVAMAAEAHEQCPARTVPKLAGGAGAASSCARVHSARTPLPTIGEIRRPHACQKGVVQETAAAKSCLGAYALVVAMASSSFGNDGPALFDLMVRQPKRRMPRRWRGRGRRCRRHRSPPPCASGSSALQHVADRRHARRATGQDQRIDRCRPHARQRRASGRSPRPIDAVAPVERPRPAPRCVISRLQLRASRVTKRNNGLRRLAECDLGLLRPVRPADAPAGPRPARSACSPGRGTAPPAVGRVQLEQHLLRCTAG